jgi:hypothetical protein
MEAARILSILVGQLSAEMVLAGGMLMIGFGDLISRVSKFGRNRGKTQWLSRYSLHIQTAWRLTQADRVLVGQEDVRLAEGDDELALVGQRLVDLSCSLLSTAHVETIEITALGDLLICLSGGLRLEAPVMNTSPFRDAERWRFFVVDNLDSHVEATGDGIWADREAWRHMLEEKDQ